MARYMLPTPEQVSGWNGWKSTRPQAVRELCDRFDPWTLYRMATGHRVIVCAFNEDGTVSVVVSGRFNRIAFERIVDGVDPDSLVECELPDPGEATGSLLDQEEAIEFCEFVRRYSTTPRSGEGGEG